MKMIIAVDFWFLMHTVGQKSEGRNLKLRVQYQSACMAGSKGTNKDQLHLSSFFFFNWKDNKL